MKLRINFYLKSGAYTLVPVIALISFGYSEFDIKKGKKVYKPIRYYTSVKVARSDWNYGINLPESKALVNELAIFEKSVEDCYNLLELKGGRITPEIFKEALDVKFGKKEVVDKLRIRLVNYIDDYIMTSNEFTTGTKAHYNQVKNKIIEFEKRIGRVLYASDINEDLFMGFVNFIRTKVTRHNAVWSNVKTFKAILNKIAKTFKIKLFNPTLELDNKDKVKAIVEDKVYLNLEQIQKIIQYKPKTERMKNVKLILLMLLFSGCRYSDVFKVKGEKLYNKGNESFRYSHFITQKGQKEVIIPILAPLMDAFKQNKDLPPTRIRVSDFDLWVKDLVRESGLKDEYSLTYLDSKGVKRFETKPFYKFISAHTGRRSFITNLINYVPITMLCKLTTHELKDNSIIFIYNKISLIDNALLFIRQLSRIRIDYKNAFPFRLV